MVVVERENKFLISGNESVLENLENWTSFLLAAEFEGGVEGGMYTHK